jgi:hypothetical protein
MASLSRVARVYVGFVEISPAMATKIQSKHGITPAEVREACSSPVTSGWHVHPTYGRRLLLTGRTAGGRLLKVVLQPVDISDGTWRLRTALVATTRRSR